MSRKQKMVTFWGDRPDAKINAWIDDGWSVAHLATSQAYVSYHSHQGGEGSCELCTSIVFERVEVGDPTEDEIERARRLAGRS